MPNQFFWVAVYSVQENNQTRFKHIILEIDDMISKADSMLAKREVGNFYLLTNASI